MTHIQGGFENTSSEKMKIPELQSDKEENIIVFKDLRLHSEIVLDLKLRILVQKKLEQYLKLIKEKPSLSIQELIKAVKQLKILLQQLIDEDKSQDYLYAEALSTNWHILLLFIENKEHLQNIQIYLGQIELFVQQVNSYAGNSDMSLGYYITQHTGEKWLPFPFMDILLSLHNNALLNKQAGTLHNWVTLLSSIASN